MSPAAPLELHDDRRSGEKQRAEPHPRRSRFPPLPFDNLGAAAPLGRGARAERGKDARCARRGGWHHAAGTALHRRPPRHTSHGADRPRRQPRGVGRQPQQVRGGCGVGMEAVWSGGSTADRIQRAPRALLLRGARRREVGGEQRAACGRLARAGERAREFRKTAEDRPTDPHCAHAPLRRHTPSRAAAGARAPARARRCRSVRRRRRCSPARGGPGASPPAQALTTGPPDAASCSDTTACGAGRRRQRSDREKDSSGLHERGHGGVTDHSSARLAALRSANACKPQTGDMWSVVVRAEVN